jgi:hypothetical protein
VDSKFCEKKFEGFGRTVEWVWGNRKGTEDIVVLVDKRLLQCLCCVVFVFPMIL